MQCEKFEARLQDLLDQRARPEYDASLLEHAESCENCRETLLLQEQLFTGLDLGEAPRMSDGFAERVLAQYLEEAASQQVVQRPTAPGKFAWKMIAGVVAASVLVAAITVGARYGANDTPQPTPTIVNKPAVEKAVTPTPSPETKTVEVVQAPVPPASSNIEAHLPDHLAAQFVSSAPEFIDGHATGRMIREVTTSLPEVSVVEETIPGLRPITSSFSLTIGMVRKTLPGGRESTPRSEPKPQPIKPQADLSRDDGQAVV